MHLLQKQSIRGIYINNIRQIILALRKIETLF